MAKRIFAGLGVLLGLALLTLWWLGLGSAPPAAKAQLAPPEVPVTAGVVAARDVPQFLQGIGTVQAFNTVTVKSRVDGQIVKVGLHRRPGGQGRATRCSRSTRGRTRRRWRRRRPPRRRTRRSSQTAQADLERYGQLVGPGFQTRQSYRPTEGLVAQLQAAIKGDQAQIETAQLNLGYTDIRSPIDGRLGARLVDVGNLVHASDNTRWSRSPSSSRSSSASRCRRTTSTQIRQQPAEGAAGRGRAGGRRQDATRRGQAHPDRQHDRPDDRHDPSQGDVRQPGRAPVAGRVRQCAAGPAVRRKGAATVPSQTVQERAERPFAYVISKNDTVERRPVEVAAVQDGLAVISKGLAPGERVVVEGQYRLTNGARIQLLPPKAAGASG